jgi:hypothetical protein
LLRLQADTQIDPFLGQAFAAIDAENLPSVAPAVLSV